MKYLCGISPCITENDPLAPGFELDETDHSEQLRGPDDSNEYEPADVE